MSCKLHGLISKPRWLRMPLKKQVDAAAVDVRPFWLCSYGRLVLESECQGIYGSIECNNIVRNGLTREYRPNKECTHPSMGAFLYAYSCCLAMLG